MDGEYEILPRDEIEELRKEVEKIKKNPFGDTKESVTLLDSMEKLTNSINKLLMLFEKTEKEIVKEYEKNKPAEALNDILDQNEKIAKGTLVVADLIKRQQKDIDMLKSSLASKKSAPVDKDKSFFESSTGSLPRDNKIPNMNDPFSQQPLGGTPKLEKVPEQIKVPDPFQKPIPEKHKKKGLFHKK